MHQNYNIKNNDSQAVNAALMLTLFYLENNLNR